MGYAVNYVEAKITSLAVDGFLLNKEKSIWDPAQNIIRFGTVINTSECLISATDSKIQSLTQDSLFLLGSKDSLFQVRELASVCDKIISLGICVGNVTRLMTRNTFAAVNSVTN